MKVSAVCVLVLLFAASANAQQTGTFQVPEIADLKRVDRNNRPNREHGQSAFILKTQPHQVDGSTYVILTDHSEKEFLAPIGRLASNYDAEILTVKDLATLHEDPKALAQLRDSLRVLQVRYLAIAPRLESFRENTILGVWELATTLDDDPQIDCYPGFLVASDAEAFSRLIEQSIIYKPVAEEDLKPFAINQVQKSHETRSLQKSAMLRKYFQQADIETPIVAIYGRRATEAPRLEGDKVWNLTVDRKEFVKEFPDGADAELAESNLIVMHGHGVPGMSCSLDVDGIPSDFSGKIVLSGSCFSASPAESDLPKMREAPGGYDVEARDAFVIRAIDNGAVVAFGHQRLSSGFPHLFPVLEHFLEGQSVGEAYQQLMNGLIELRNTKSGDFVISEEGKANKRVPQNRFLYVLIGDPALRPLQPQPLLK